MNQIFGQDMTKSRSEVTSNSLELELNLGYRKLRHGVPNRG
jgi:hypothetical protein